ncbi:serine hydrolase domain-containing protein [Gaiella sp.]|uniref:serine hydrolase domain-containing protein n=1 Tax=Gaiella sp. TaxID=2663207 RepID=UPI003983A145
MESDVGDQRRFPVRRVPAGADASPLPVGAATDLPVGPDDEDRGGAVLDELLDETGTLAFLVVHKDRLVYERYFGGSDRRTLETSFSVAKSFVSALVGIAIDEGVIGGVEDPVTDYLPELAARDPRFREITLRDLLTMSSGIRYRESDLPWPWSDDTYTYYGVNLREAALAQTRVERPPRQAWHYNNNHHPLLLGLVLERATGMSVSDYQAVAAAGSPKRCHLESRLRAIGVRETGERPQRHGRRLRGSPGVTCAA